MTDKENSGEWNLDTMRHNYKIYDGPRLIEILYS